MTFMKKYGFGAVGYNFVLSAMTVQYAILINNFFHNIFTGHVNSDGDGKIQLSIVHLIQGDFAAGAVMISFGAVLGKASLPQLIVMMIFELIFYAINEGLGAVQFEAVDMGGSMFVHSFGAYFGLAVSK